MRIVIGFAFFALAAVVGAQDVRLQLEPDIASAIGRAPNWHKGERAQGGEKVRPIFMLRHDPSDLASFEKTLFEVSTPGSSRYGQHLTRAQVSQQLPPVKDAREVVLSLLSEHGVDAKEVSVGTDTIAAIMSVETAEAMLDTTFYHFKHKAFGIDLIKAGRPYSLPAAAAEALYLAGNLVQLPTLDGVKKVKTDNVIAETFPNGCGSGCNGKVTPDVLKQAYGFDDAPTGQNTTMAVAEFGSFWDTQDLDYFSTECKLKPPVKVDHQIGKNNQSSCLAPFFGAEVCGEALLDIQYIKSVAGDIPLTCISSATFSLLDWAEQLDKMEDVPLVHSVSYGNDEINQTSAAFMEAANAQFMKLGARGVSLLFASGDQGVYGRSGQQSDGKFHPDFPAASPYITAVGGTDFAQKSVIGAEKAWIDGGGGFSNTFAAPVYQKDVVASYLAAASAAGKLPTASHFNSTGRGYPDVAALAGDQNPYCYASTLFFNSSMTSASGTSASCPVVAGLFARLNALRAGSGKPPLGFLNPFIYKNPGAFNDVSLGVNTGEGKEGFAAIEGWDAATGLGTPNFPKLKAAAMAAVDSQMAAAEVVV